MRVGKLKESGGRMSNKKLLPCMCCGCTNIYKIEEPDEIVDKVPALFCNGCKVIFKVENDSPYLNDDETYKYLEEKTINAWNTRVPMQKIVERLEERIVEMKKAVCLLPTQQYEHSLEIVKEEGGLND